MYIGMYVYNTLNRLVRRIIDKMSITVLAMSSLAFMAIGFTLILASGNKADSPYFIAGAILILISCLSWYRAIYLAKRADENREGGETRREGQMQSFIDELKGFRKDFNESRGTSQKVTKEK